MKQLRILAHYLRCFVRFVPQASAADMLREHTGQHERVAIFHADADSTASAAASQGRPARNTRDHA
jgi:hypothetical protein